MPNWKDSLCDANSARTLERARSCAGKGVEYKLGHGGMNPERPMGRTCDCSGFVAWSIGIPRELPPRSGRWLDTDAYWGGGGACRIAAGFPLFKEIPVSAAQPGDVLVYPDTRSPRRQGHMGIITKIDGALKVVHCSLGNWTRHSDAIRETDATVFTRDMRTRAMRIDYAAVRRYLGVPEPTAPAVAPDTPDEETTPTLPPRPSARTLKHTLLATNPTLLRVLAGELVLEPARIAASGVGAVQQGLNILARDDSEFLIDLGPSDRNLGVFGPKTQKSLKHLQKLAGLPRTGIIDAETLKALDRMLMEHAEGTDTDEDVVEGGRIDDNTVTEPVVTAEVAPIELTLRNDSNRWSASADGGPRFYVGHRVRFEARRGLTNNDDAATVVYRPAPYAERFGHWAYLIYPSVMAESQGRFQMLNTYDRARFTFSFFQFAAHVADGDFVRFFRALLADEVERRRYFPDLELHPTTGRIMRRTAGGLLPLETAASTEDLMRYLNPSDTEVEDREVLQSARFIHWSLNSARHQEIQVRTSVETAKRHLRGAQNHINLDGRGDKVCLAVMDNLHQGRAKYSVMKPLVENNDDDTAYDKLMKIRNDVEYIRNRAATVRRHVALLEESGHLGGKRYSAGAGDFV